MRRFALPVFAVLVAALLLVGGCRQAGQEFALPADLAALLPDGPTAIVAARSLDAVDAAVAELEAGGGGQPLLPPGMASDLDLRALLARAVPDLAPLVDGGRPLALAVVAPPPMSDDIAVTLVVPLRDAGAPRPALAEPFVAETVRGRYLALSTVAAAAAAEPPALAAGLHPGVVTVALDLDGLISQYRGMIEIGLGAMALAPSSNSGASGSSQPAMSPEEAAALATMMRGLMDSLRRVDLALDLADGALTLSGAVGVQADGPLRPGPQPDFGAALALAGLLPADADMLQASAMDQSGEMDFMREFYLASIRNEAADLPPEAAAGYQAWFEDYLAMVPQLSCPMAAAVDFAADGLGALALIRPDDPAALAEACARHLALLADAGLGVTVTSLDGGTVAGATVRRWRIDFDDTVLAALGDDVFAGGGSQQAAQMLMMARSLLPTVNLAVQGPLVAVGAMEPAAFDAALVRAGGRPGKPDPRLARAAAAAGPECRQVAVGDLTPLANWLAGLIAEMSGQDPQPVLEAPVPFTAVNTIGAGGYGFALSTEVPALHAAAAAFGAMVEAQQGD